MSTRARDVVRPSDELIIESARAHNPLIRGVDLLCPGCETWQNILRYRPMGYAKKYADQLVVPVLRCTSCSHIFALKP